MKKDTPIYHIIEVANTHGGNITYLKDLIQEFSEFEGGFGMKFQPLLADNMATPDFEWYNVYKELEFSLEQWEQILELAAETKEIWIDVFDLFGVNVIECNLSRIHGIKFQSSVLDNIEVFTALKALDLSDVKIILNVAGRNIDNIGSVIKKAEVMLDPKEIILEFGFQGYPTALENCGLSKIGAIRKNFSNRIVFSDHTDGSTDDAVLPAVAVAMGVDIIEKHVMLDRETKYDHFSSLSPVRFKMMLEKTNRYHNILNQDFINEREELYLKKTLMIPILNRNLNAGTIISPERDFTFKRTNKGGLDVNQISHFCKEGYVLSTNKKKGETLGKIDLKKASIATIIACRLKSSRLPKKALLKIGDLTSVEYCISNALKFENVHHTILATSTMEQDEELRNFTYSPSVIFHQGDPDDVIQRYLDICDSLKTDVFIRVTADMPFIDNEICQHLLSAHFESGADYTTAKSSAVGTNLEIINVQALHFVKKQFPNADMSEYMTWYFQNNPEHFDLNFVSLPKELVRNYRLTLDYQEDLDLFNHIYKNFGSKEFSLREVFRFLDDNPKISKLNDHLTLKYRTDEKLIEILNKKTKIPKI